MDVEEEWHHEPCSPLHRVVPNGRLVRRTGGERRPFPNGKTGALIAAVQNANHAGKDGHDARVLLRAPDGGVSTVWVFGTDSYPSPWVEDLHRIAQQPRRQRARASAVPDLAATPSRSLPWRCEDPGAGQHRVGFSPRPGLTDRTGVDYAPTSSVQTRNSVSVLGPKVWVSGTSAASRPCAIRMRPIRGALLRGSKTCQRPPR